MTGHSHSPDEHHFDRGMLPNNLHRTKRRPPRTITLRSGDTAPVGAPFNGGIVEFRDSGPRTFYLTHPQGNRKDRRARAKWQQALDAAPERAYHEGRYTAAWHALQETREVDIEDIHDMQAGGDLHDHVPPVMYE